MKSPTLEKSDASANGTESILTQAETLAAFMTRRATFYRGTNRAQTVQEELARWHEEVVNLQELAARTPREQLDGSANRVDRLISDMLDYHRSATRSKAASVSRTFALPHDEDAQYDFPGER